MLIATVIHQQMQKGRVVLITVSIGCKTLTVIWIETSSTMLLKFCYQGRLGESDTVLQNFLDSLA